MIDRNICLSHFLAFRYVYDDAEFCSNIRHQRYHRQNIRSTYIHSAKDLDIALRNVFRMISNERLGLLLSGGMDSAILASYMPQGSDAYTFRFNGGSFQSDELHRAEEYASYCHLNLNYIDIDWPAVEGCVDVCMKRKGAPVHSIEPQIYCAAKASKEKGNTLIVIGDGADYVFGGMDGLYANDWSFDGFIKRYIYIDPKEALVEPADISSVFEPYRIGPNSIDYMSFLNELCTDESYASYENAIGAAGICHIDPYANMRMAPPLDISRLRNNDSKYIIRELFRMRYNNFPIPKKNPMPRPVDDFFLDWQGPTRPEFRKDIPINELTGNQKWQLWCAERFLNMID